MGLNNYIIISMAGILILFLSGCASLQAKSEAKNVYEQGYRAGVKEQMEDISARFQGGQFPYYNWSAPIVQDVKVPAHIQQGVFIPEHNELVLIKPGEWQKSPAYPITTGEKQTHEQQNKPNIADVSNLTVLP
jgi:uncharacterized protein YceK